MELIILAGFVCVAWTAGELALATSRGSVRVGPHARFGAVDADGRALDVVLDRRTDFRGRRTAEAGPFSLHV